MKVVLSAVGSRGDLQPLTVLGEALMARGHDVVLLGPPEAQGLSEARGVPYVGCGRDMMAWIQSIDVVALGMRKIFAVFKDLIDADLHTMAPVLVEACRGAAVVVTAGLQLLGRTAAEAVGARSTYLYYAPGLLPSDEHPPIVVDLQRLPKLANRAFHNVTLGFMNRTVLRPLNRERVALGLAPHKDMADAMSLDLTLAYDAALAPAPTDLAHSWRRLKIAPRTSTQVGAIVPQDGVVDDALAEFVRAKPCVYVGFGSMPDVTATATLAIVDEAARSAGVRAVMLGAQELIDGGGTERVRVIAHAAHAALFPMMRAVVHHGGAGTTATAARAGVPQVVVPHFVDQSYWAHRLELRGVCATSIKRRQLDARRLGEALRRVVDDAGLTERARTLGAELAQTDSIANAVAHVERLAAQ